MKVSLERVVGKDELGGDIPHAISLVFIEHSALKKFNAAGKINVGSIGIQEGANFMPNSEFYRVLGEPNRQAVVDEVKRIHGSASPEPHVELPPLPKKVHS